MYTKSWVDLAFEGLTIGWALTAVIMFGAIYVVGDGVMTFDINRFGENHIEIFLAIAWICLALYELYNYIFTPHTKTPVQDDWYQTHTSKHLTKW